MPRLNWATALAPAASAAVAVALATTIRRAELASRHHLEAFSQRRSGLPHALPRRRVANSHGNPEEKRRGARRWGRAGQQAGGEKRGEQHAD